MSAHEYTPLDALESHLSMPASDGPGYCRGCDWQSRQIGISSHLQHRAHVAKVIADEVAAVVAAAEKRGAVNALREAGEAWGDSTWAEVWLLDGVEDDVQAVQSTVKWLNARADQIEATDE